MDMPTTSDGHANGGGGHNQYNHAYDLQDVKWDGYTSDGSGGKDGSILSRLVVISATPHRTTYTPVMHRSCKKVTGYGTAHGAAYQPTSHAHEYTFRKKRTVESREG